MTTDKNQTETFLRIEEIALGLEQDEAVFLAKKIAEILMLDPGQLIGHRIVKRAIDARKKNRISFVYSVDAEVVNPEKIIANLENTSDLNIVKLRQHKIRLVRPFSYAISRVKAGKEAKRPLIVGSGPAGLFSALVLAQAGMNPIIIERGRDVDARVKDVSSFFSDGTLDPKSNIQFGEGGAGTFSDGKLYTLINNPRTRFIFEEFVIAGAPEEILWNSRPHIGTDRLRRVVKNLRKKIISLGGEVRFETCLTGLDIKNGRIASAVVNGSEKIPASDIILAIGHSARDTYEMLYAEKLNIEAKPFSVGLRIEHEAELINRALYGKFAGHAKLSAATYKLVAHLPGARSVYTFCMCPGGYVVAAASEKGRLVTNGMSEFSQDSKYSNSALLCGVRPSDFGSASPLAGMEFQRHWEEQAFLAGGGDYRAPAQLVGDFLKNRSSSGTGGKESTYKPSIRLTSLNGCLPDYAIDSIRQALPIFDKKIKNFAHPDALLLGVETRSSAPLRLLRDKSGQSNIRGLYPTGEGAGYAGGIVSSAIDGMMMAEAIVEKYKK